MLPGYPLTEIQSDFEKHKQSLVDIMYSYGALRKKSPNEIVNVGMSVNPKLISKKEYNDLKLDSHSFNKDLVELYHKFDQIKPFIKEHCEGDELVELLLKIVDTADSQGRSDKKIVGLILRNDFMYDSEKKEFLQVEFNCMSVGLGQLTTKISDLLNHFYRTILRKPLNFVKNNNYLKQQETYTQLYHSYGNNNAIILEVMLDPEPNIFDSIPNERFFNLSEIDIHRVVLSQIIPENYTFDDKSKKLTFMGKEVAIVYFRSMYSPEHFEGHRLQFMVQAERSKTIMLPDIRFFLLGIKITQHLLNSPVLLDQYGLSNLKDSQFSKHYCPSYLLKIDFNNDRQKMLKFAEQHKDRLLIKSFGEGGMGIILGNNDMIEFIKNETMENLHKILLSHRMNSVPTDSLALLNHELKVVKDTTSEMSIYSSLIIKTKDNEKPVVVLDEVWDYLLRTKNKAEVKGGMNINVSFMDNLAYLD